MSAYIEVTSDFWLDPADVLRHQYIAGTEACRPEIMFWLRSGSMRSIPGDHVLCEQTGHRIRIALEEDRRANTRVFVPFTDRDSNMPKTDEYTDGYYWCRGGTDWGISHPYVEYIRFRDGRAHIESRSVGCEYHYDIHGRTLWAPNEEIILIAAIDEPVETDDE